MAASRSLYQQIVERIAAVTRPDEMAGRSVVRLALLVMGILAAQSSVLAQIAAALHGLGLTCAQQPESVLRGLRRTLRSAGLRSSASVQAVVRRALDWEAVQQQGWVVLLLDESSQDERVHLVRVSLAYRGGSLPVAWALWEQQAPLPEGSYWQQLDRVLEEAAALVPAGVPVLLLADRAYDIPPLVDRLTARGWHWIVRCKANSTLRFREVTGRERALREVLRWRMGRPGRRWKGRGQVFKKAGWRTVSIVGMWDCGHKEALVVISDLPPRWDLVGWYDRRFWIECGFRNDKAQGWQWEQSRVPGCERQAVLLLAMAWASLVTVLLGVRQAQDALVALGRRRQRRSRATGAPCPVGRPERARQSLFRMGLDRLRAMLWQRRSDALVWRLPNPLAPSWLAEWRTAQARRFLLLPTVPL